MNTSRTIDLFAAGMAIFAMYFGAGNIIFPLALGKVALDKTFFALAGLLLTGVALPITAFVTMFLYQGKIQEFFGRIGKIPGMILACITIALLGPLGCAPRCIVLAYSTVSMSFPGIPLILFSAISCVFIFLFAFNKGRFLGLLGYVLSPFKIALLVAIMVIGLVNIPEMFSLASDQTKANLFYHGLKEGYNTMDLLGSFFFAPVLLASLITKDKSENREVGRFVLKASAIGAFLLSAIYIGFCYLASIYASELAGISSDRLLGAIAIKVLGPIGGYIVSLTVAVACFTTAIALIAAFSNFVQNDIFKGRVKYIPVVIGSLLVTFTLSILDFQGLSNFLTPVLQVCYPILIALTAYNLIHRLFIHKENRNELVELKN